MVCSEGRGDVKETVLSMIEATSGSAEPTLNPRSSQIKRFDRIHILRRVRMLETAVGSKSETFVWPESVRLSPDPPVWLQQENNPRNEKKRLRVLPGCCYGNARPCVMRQVWSVSVFQKLSSKNQEACRKVSLFLSSEQKQAFDYSHRCCRTFSYFLQI